MHDGTLRKKTKWEAEEYKRKEQRKIEERKTTRERKCTLAYLAYSAPAAAGETGMFSPIPHGTKTGHFLSPACSAALHFLLSKSHTKPTIILTSLCAICSTHFNQHLTLKSFEHDVWRHFLSALVIELNIIHARKSRQVLKLPTLLFLIFLASAHTGASSQKSTLCTVFW